MAQRIAIVTELGRELKCNRCSDFWPADEEFWYRASKNRLSNWCKACYLEWRNENRQKNAAKSEEKRAAA
jgi:hypothetical protein